VDRLFSGIPKFTALKKLKISCTIGRLRAKLGSAAAHIETVVGLATASCRTVLKPSSSR